MTCENNGKDQKFSREYKYLLSKIRPLIEQLDKSKDAQLCLLWLSKLDQCSHWEECERNEILCELSRQVKNKSLEPPFNSQPPPGPLKNIVLHKNSVPLWGNNRFCDDISSEMTSETRRSVSTLSTLSCGDECQNRLALLRGGPKDIAQKTISVDHSHCLALQQKYQERLANDQLLLTRYHEIIKSLITQRFKNPTAIKLKSMKSSYESKLYQLTASLKEVEDENKMLREKLAGGISHVEKLQEIMTRNGRLEDEIKRLELENTALDIKCRELEMQKNNSLSVLEGEMKREMEKLIKEKDDFIKSMEMKCEENFWNCKNEHQREISELEKKYTSELSNLERILEERDTEINRLKMQIHHSEEKIRKMKYEMLENHDLDKERNKVKFLKSKLKSLFKNQENMANTFQVQLEQIISKKDLLISTLEMKVKSSDVEYSPNGAHNELEDVVNEKVQFLESQYKILLEEAENQAAQRRQMDIQKILTLEKQLVDNGVGVQDLSTIPEEEDQDLDSNDNKEGNK